MVLEVKTQEELEGEDKLMEMKKLRMKCRKFTLKQVWETGEGEELLMVKMIRSTKLKKKVVGI